jgi:sugar/nucleoside kinase (ribokinase family)
VPERKIIDIMKHCMPILVVGSGNAEYIINLDQKWHQDQKYVVKYHELLGGSGVNYTLRLLHAGIPVYPILSVGRDEFGQRIKNEILSCKFALNRSDEALEFINSENFLIRDFKTPRATIVVSERNRTIFSEQIVYSKNYSSHLKKCVAAYKNRFLNRFNTVMIGHILADNPENNNPEEPGACTRLLIRTFQDDSLIFANFGYSQICLGADFWEKDLQKVSVFQLNLKEMKTFFNQKDVTICLEDMLHWLRKRQITAIITIDRYGAIGTYKDGSDGVILAWPKEISGIVDTTGAGDAFGAGLMSKLYGKPKFTCDDFCDAIEAARIWAAYACTHFGASAFCPDSLTLQKFQKNFSSDPIEILTGREARRMLKVFDKM